MRTKLLALLIVAAMLIGLLAACADGSPTTEQESTPHVLSTPPPGATCPVPGGTPVMADPSASTQEAILAFSQAMFRAVLAADEENPVISPLSAYYALAMVALGAQGDTAAEFQAVLGRDSLELAADLLALTQSLTATSGSTALAIAGGVWTADDFVINPDFATLLEKYFDAPARSRNFADPATVQEINRWIYERTYGLLDDVIDSIGRDAVMLLVNTLYFSGQWADAFNPMTAHPGTFYTESGASVERPFLSTRSSSFSVAVTDSFEAVSLPYDDDRLGFLLVRPTDGTSIRDFAQDFDLAAILDSLAMRHEVRVRMPKLDLEFEITLNAVLQNMGLILPFSDHADFTGLSAENEDLRISSVLQKVRLLVDEEGTEAAAVTVIEIERTAIALDLLELNFNTPYLYVIYDMQTGIPLFMGILEG